MGMMRITAEQKEYIRDLIRAKEATGGVFEVDDLIADARRAASPINVLFDFEHERLVQEALRARGRAILHRVGYNVSRRVTMVHGFTAPSFVLRHPDMAPKQQGYISVERVIEDKDRLLARRILTQEFERAAAHIRRARDVAITLGFENEVRSLLASVTRILNEVQKLRGDTAA